MSHFWARSALFVYLLPSALAFYNPSINGAMDATRMRFAVKTDAVTAAARTPGQLRVVENSGVCETTPGVYQASGYVDLTADDSMWCVVWFFGQCNFITTHNCHQVLVLRRQERFRHCTSHYRDKRGCTSARKHKCELEDADHLLSLVALACLTSSTNTAHAGPRTTLTPSFPMRCRGTKSPICRLCVTGG